MKKYLYFPTTRDLWLDLSRTLHSRGVAEPILWIGHRNLDKRASAAFPDCVVLDFNRLNKGLSACVSGTDDFQWEDDLLATKMLQEAWFSEIKDQAIRMLDRKDYFGAFRAIDREAIFYRLYYQFHRFVSRQNPDFLLMAEPPHSIAQFLVYEICKYAEIPVISFMSCSAAPAVFIKQGIEKPFLDLSGVEQRTQRQSAKDEIDLMIQGFSHHTEAPQQPRYMLNQYRKERRKRISRIFKTLKDIIRSALHPLLPRSLRTRSHQAFHGFSAFSDYPGPFSEILKYVTEARAQKALVSACSKHSLSIDAIPKKYVFFPLHYEPERTTNPDGGQWNNQYVALAKLRHIVPHDIAIVVKEHPSQLGSVLQGFRGRSRFFYSSVSAMKNTVFADINIPSWKLQSSAMFTCTITGTAALEAAINGKPALLLGYPWFRGCPGITTLDDSTTVESITRNTVPLEKIRYFLHHLLESHSIFGVINPSNEKYFSNYFSSDLARADELTGIADATAMIIEEYVQTGKNPS